jgi:hypothetical protein
MSQEEDLFAYDEDDAVRYILNVLPQELKEKYLKRLKKLTFL